MRQVLQRAKTTGARAAGSSIPADYIEIESRLRSRSFRGATLGQQTLQKNLCRSNASARASVKMVTAYSLCGSVRCGNLIPGPRSAHEHSLSHRFARPSGLNLAVSLIEWA